MPRIVQQPLHHALVRIRPRIREKRLQLLARRRQPDEIEINAAQHHALPRFRQRGQPVLPEFRRDEGVERIANRPLRYVARPHGTRRNAGHRRPHRRLERPMFPRVRFTLLARR